MLLEQQKECEKEKWSRGTCIEEFVKRKRMCAGRRKEGTRKERR